MHYIAYSWEVDMITFDRNPENYKHWKVVIEEHKATLFLDVSVMI